MEVVSGRVVGGGWCMGGRWVVGGALALALSICFVTLARSIFGQATCGFYDKAPTLSCATED